MANWLPPLAWLAGLAAGVCIVVGANAPPKAGAAILAGTVFAAGAVVVGLRRACLYAFLFFIPVPLDINFFYRDNAGSTGGLVVSAADLCLVPLIALVLLRLATGTTRPRVDWPLVLPAFLALVTGALSLVGTEYLALGAFELYRVAKATVILMLLPNVIRDEGDLKVAFCVLFLGMVIQACLVFAQLALGTTLGLGVLGEDRELLTQPLLTGTFNRASGTLLHPNTLAVYFGLLLFIGLAVVMYARWSTGVLVVAAATLTGFVTVVLTLSRGAWTAFAVASVVLVTLGYRRFPGRRVPTVTSVLVAAVVLVLAVALPTLVHERLFAPDFQAAHLRIPLAMIALRMVAISPIVGVGINSYAKVVPRFILNETPEMIPPWYSVDNMVVHNLYLLVMVETGLLGLLAFAWFMGALLARARRLLVSTSDWRSPVALGIGCGIVSFLLAELVDNSYRIGQSLMYLVYTLGGLLTVMKVVEETT